MKNKENNYEQCNISLGFILDLEKILNYLVEHKECFAKTNNVEIKYLGENKETQVFEIQRKVEE